MLNRRISRWLLGACVLGCAVAAPRAAAAAPVLDQEFVGDLSPNLFLLCENFVCGQSFTVGITGTLTSAQLYINGLSGTGDTTVGIYSTTGAGGIDTLLTSVLFPSASFTSATFYSFAFSLPVTSGDVLAIGTVTSTGNLIQLAGDVIPDYPSGTLIVDGLPDSIGDAYFRTFVDRADVPEPISFALFAIGLAGAGIRRRRPGRTR